LTIFIILLIITFTILIIGQIKSATILLSPIYGFMVGALYSKDEYEDLEEITLQCCIGIISITVIWIKNQNGSVR